MVPLIGRFMDGNSLLRDPFYEPISQKKLTKKAPLDASIGYSTKGTSNRKLSELPPLIDRAPRKG